MVSHSSSSANATTTTFASSKFRARKLDHHKHLKIYDLVELEELGDESEIISAVSHDASHRTAPLVATGVDKEEEEEEHLQAALSSAMVAPKSQAFVIPTPKVEEIDCAIYDTMYPPMAKSTAPSTKSPPTCSNLAFLSSSAMSLTNEYAVDEQDEQFCRELHIEPSVLEDLFVMWEETAARLSVKSTSVHSALERFPALSEASANALLQYWQGKRMAVLETEDQDPTKIGADPFVCFRRRELKLPRKTRRSDAQCLDKLRKMRFELDTLATGLQICHMRDSLKLQSWEQEQQLFLAYARLSSAEAAKAPAFKLVVNRRYQPESLTTQKKVQASRNTLQRGLPTSRATGPMPANVDIVMEVESLLDKMRFPTTSLAYSQPYRVTRDSLGRPLIVRTTSAAGSLLQPAAPGSLSLKECAMINVASIGNYNHHYVQNSSGLQMPLSLSGWMHLSHEHQLALDYVNATTGHGNKKSKKAAPKPAASTTSSLMSTHKTTLPPTPHVPSANPANFGSNSNGPTTNITVKVKSRTEGQMMSPLSNSVHASPSSGPGEPNAHHHTGNSANASVFTPTGLSSSPSSLTGHGRFTKGTNQRRESRDESNNKT